MRIFMNIWALKIWVWAGGESLFWLRLFPVVVSALCLIPLFLLCRDLGISRGARNMALLIGSVHPYAIYFAQHMRMYCVLELFGLASIWAFQRYLKDGSRRNLVVLSVANLLLVCSHYYGWLIVGLEFLYLLRRKRSVLGPFTVAGLLVFTVAGECAALRAGGPGSFAVELLDALSNLDRETLCAQARVR